MAETRRWGQGFLRRRNVREAHRPKFILQGALVPSSREPGSFKKAVSQGILLLGFSKTHCVSLYII
jgi:hypothetical protein